MQKLFKKISSLCFVDGSLIDFCRLLFERSRTCFCTFDLTGVEPIELILSWKGVELFRDPDESLLAALGLVIEAVRDGKTNLGLKL